MVDAWTCFTTGFCSWCSAPEMRPQGVEFHLLLTLPISAYLELCGLPDRCVRGFELVSIGMPANVRESSYG